MEGNVVFPVAKSVAVNKVDFFLSFGDSVFSRSPGFAPFNLNNVFAVFTRAPYPLDPDYLVFINPAVSFAVHTGVTSTILHGQTGRIFQKDGRQSITFHTKNLNTLANLPSVKHIHPIIKCLNSTT